MVVRKSLGEIHTGSIPVSGTIIFEKTAYRTISVSEQAYLENDIGDYIDDLNSIKEKA